MILNGQLDLFENGFKSGGNSTIKVLWSPVGFY